MIDESLKIDWLLLGLGLAVLAILIWNWTRGHRAGVDMPEGKVIYADGGTWYRQEASLYSSHLRLVGRPDFLVEQVDGLIIPVEMKSSRAPNRLFESHIMQLAAYCVLVEETYHVRPTHGILQYSDRAFAVDFTPELEEDLFEVMELLRQDMFDPELSRDHDDIYRCQGCNLREGCTERLV